MGKETDIDYYFLVGVLNSEFEGERSFVPLYGFTEILPGRITTDRVVSADGSSYLDLARNAFRIGDNNSSLSWNTDENRQLSIENANFEIGNEDDEVVARIDGETGAAIFGKGVHKFDADGTLNIANDNIIWNLLDGLLVRGKFESNKGDDNKIIINPKTRSLELTTPSKGVVGRWSFIDNASILQILDKPSDIQTNEIQMNGNTISFIRRTGSGTSGARFGITGIRITPQNFPVKTNLADLEIGEFYRDGEYIKMKISD